MQAGQVKAQTLEISGRMREPKEEQPTGPLCDLKVLNLAWPIGVYCAKLMADLVADVVRIEPSRGDSMREIGPSFDDKLI